MPQALAQVPATPLLDDPSTIHGRLSSKPNPLLGVANGVAAYSAITHPRFSPAIERAARAAITIPFPQQADMSSLPKQGDTILPGGLKELIRSLLGKNSKNRGVVLGDTNHFNEHLQSALQDTALVPVFLECGITHIGLEITPKRLEEIFAEGAEDEKNKKATMPFYDFIKACRDKGVEIIAMDARSSDLKEGYSGMLTRIMAANNVPQKRENESPQDYNIRLKTYVAKEMAYVSEERNRVTNQVWVPRLVDILKKNPHSKFVVIAGNRHVSNVAEFDHLRYDLDEGLARELNAPVVYVRTETGAVPQAIAHITNLQDRLSTLKNPQNGYDVPEVVLTLPQNAAVKPRPPADKKPETQLGPEIPQPFMLPKIPSKQLPIR